jgi:hypothetical protein
MTFSARNLNAVETLHKFTLGKTFSFHLHKKLEYLLNSSEFATNRCERNTPWIYSRLEVCRIFSLNTGSRNIYFEFYKILGIILPRACHTIYLTNIGSTHRYLPWGTQQEISPSFELSPHIQTNCFLLFKVLLHATYFWTYFFSLNKNSVL